MASRQITSDPRPRPGGRALPQRRPAIAGWTRRALLAGLAVAGAAATSVAGVPVAGIAVPRDAAPFSDGTWFADRTGWA